MNEKVPTGALTWIDGGVYAIGWVRPDGTACVQTINIMPTGKIIMLEAIEFPKEGITP